MDLYTAEELCANLSLIDEFTLEQCFEFRQRYLNKRKPKCLKTIREKLSERETAIKINHKTWRLETRIRCVYARLHEVWEFQSDDEETCLLEKEFHGRSLGNDLWDVPSIPLGVASVEALRTGTYTEEHFWPRSIASGPDIVSSVLLQQKRFTIKTLIKLLYTYAQTTRTTQEENNRLHTYHTKYPFLNPIQSYQDCNIQLVRFSDFNIPPQWKKVLKKYKIFEHEPFSFDNVLSFNEAVDRKLVPKNIKWKKGKR